MEHAAYPAPEPADCAGPLFATGLEGIRRSSAYGRLIRWIAPRWMPLTAERIPWGIAQENILWGMRDSLRAKEQARTRLYLWIMQA